MKKYLFALAFSCGASAHDGGHGPKLTDSAKQGGVLAPVVRMAEAKKGNKAEVVHKAELTRNADGTVRVYIYDKAMEPLALSSFSESAKGVLEFKNRKTKKWEHLNFVLKSEGDAFVGKSPKVSAKPFNIDVHLKQGSEELLTAFDNLD